MNQSEAKTNEQIYPAVDLAYPLAVASYEQVQKRLDIIDNRLQTVIALGATVSLAVPTWASTKGLDFSSRWFIAAASVLACGLVLGTFARVVGNTILINPSRLHKDWLSFSEWEFKQNFIHYAGIHFEANRALARRRGQLTTATVVLFILGGLLLSVWASLPRP